MYPDAKELRNALDRIRELEAENAALKETIKMDNWAQEIVEAKNKEVARKDAALEAADKALVFAYEQLDECRNCRKSTAVEVVHAAGLEVTAALKEEKG